MKTPQNSTRLRATAAATARNFRRTRACSPRLDVAVWTLQAIAFVGTAQIIISWIANS